MIAAALVGLLAALYLAHVAAYPRLRYWLDQALARALGVSDEPDRDHDQGSAEYPG